MVLGVFLFRDLCIVLVDLLWPMLFVLLALWWPLCNNCSFLSCVVDGCSGFILFCVVSLVFWMASHSDWSSWVVSSSAAALRSQVVPGCGVTDLTSLTWCTEFFHGSNSCLSCSIMAVASCCGVLLFCLVNELLW